MDDTQNNHKGSMLENITRTIETVDNKNKKVLEITTIVKGVMAKDPNALDGNIAEYYCRGHFGDNMYDKIRKLYQEIISK